ncbi:cupin domain-containing protein [Terriglobus roseus DSM 18391]|uniref:Cupin domain-containing protein n=1 Tax=Terriglobus roseus (strain DSM 18391 / NRRL B-41598 / KBS 63) TaxID=926566 RepID=I3ZDH3_TERRK|nr:cupin domain-containing protein [Terriglobus roseus]AFL87291.1 cupin domain-containing protein [Terriglobus roseus DSM 18391]
MAEGVTHIVPTTSGPALQDGVVTVEALQAEGAAPGATAYVHYNGPTNQLTTLCSGMCVLEPGASPHPPHQHPEEETMIVAEGTGEITVDGKTTSVGPGAIMYTAANTWHGIVNTGKTPMTFYFSKWLARGSEAPTA